MPTVTTEPRVKFLKGFPRIGGYTAAAVPAGSAGPTAGAYQAVLAADTLLPDGHGQALTQEEVTGRAGSFSTTRTMKCGGIGHPFII